MFSITQRNFDIFKKPGIYLHDVYILPAYRHQGIATGMLAKMRDIAKTRDCGRIDWLVLKDNVFANAFYKITIHSYYSQQRQIFCRCQYKIVNFFDSRLMYINESITMSRV